MSTSTSEYLWNGITYDPDDPDRNAYLTDPALPGVLGSEIVCPGCGQSVDVICGEALIIPDRHYPQPTLVKVGGGGRSVRVATSAGGSPGVGRQPVCSFTGDHLHTVVYRAQLAQSVDVAA